MSLRAKILLSISVVALVVAGAMVATQYYTRKAQLLQEFQFFVRSVAGTASLSISGDDVKSIRSNADVSGPAFQRLRGYLDKVRHMNNLEEQEIYVLRPMSPDSFETEFVVMLQP